MQAQADPDERASQDALWTTLIGISPKPIIGAYISNSAVCINEILPNIVKGKVEDYVKGDEKRARSRHVNTKGVLKGRESAPV